MTLRILCCTPNESLVPQLRSVLPPGWKIDHTPHPAALAASGKESPECVVIDMNVSNALSMAESAIEKSNCISIVTTYDEVLRRRNAGDFDCFQRRNLDMGVLAARIGHAYAEKYAVAVD